jgi:uncharacterized RDD family membrane protein YckC
MDLNTRDPVNPYAPPQCEAGAVAATAGVLLDAPVAKRFLNLLLDQVGCFLVLAAIELACVLVGYRTDGGILDQLKGPGAMVVYYLFFEGLFGRTPGKLLTGTRVVRRDGGTPRFAQIVGRTFARFVPFEPVSFLIRAPNGWHDVWSGTRVVQVRQVGRVEER